MKKASEQRLEQWYSENVTQRMLDDLWIHYGFRLTFDWVLEQVYKAGLEYVLTPGYHRLTMKFEMKSPRAGSKYWSALFSFFDLTNNAKLYTVELPQTYAFSISAGKIIRVKTP